MTPHESGLLLETQRSYYEARAPEYEDWWFRRGRYDAGPVENARWFADVRELEDALDRFRPSGRTLELAAGTGLWTERLLSYTDLVTAIDYSPTMLRLNARRTGGRATYVRADGLEWRPTDAYDVCFFSFWLSHVPSSRFGGFWETVRGSLTSDGRVFFIDSAAPSRWDDQATSESVRRTLSDGREYEIVKRYYEPAALERELAAVGFQAEVSRTSSYFIYGSASLAK